MGINLINDNLVYSNSIARYYITGTPAYGAGGTPIPFNQLSYNSGGGIELTGTDGEFEVKFDGFLKVRAQTQWTADIGAGQVMTIVRNNATVSQGPENSVGAITSKQIDDTFEVSTGDIIAVRFTNTGTLSGNPAYCYIAMERVATYTAGQPAGFGVATNALFGLVKTGIKEDTGWIDFTNGTSAGDWDTSGGGPLSIVGRWKFTCDSQDRWYMDFMLASQDFSSAGNNNFTLGTLKGIAVDASLEGPSTFSSFSGVVCTLENIRGGKTVLLKNTGTPEILCSLMTENIQPFSNTYMSLVGSNIPLESKPTFL
jgi:hypothetical protein